MAHDARNGHRASVRFHQRLDDGETEASAAVLAGTGFVHAVEALKQMRQMLGTDARPGVRDGQHGLVCPSAEHSAASRFHPQACSGSRSRRDSGTHAPARRHRPIHHRPARRHRQAKRCVCCCLCRQASPRTRPHTAGDIHRLTEWRWIHPRPTSPAKEDSP
jgi:hypothetical protein